MRQGPELGARTAADLSFRREAGRIAASLVRRFGSAQLAAIEDAVQTALVRALDLWPHQGVPAEPGAWLQRVAHNALLTELRGERRAHERHHTLEAEVQLAPAHDRGPSAPASPFGPDDDLLHLLFVCCDPRLKTEAQLVLALRTLCGFNTKEIASRLLTSEANVRKRHQRALAILREVADGADAELGERLAVELDEGTLAARLPAVQLIVYLVLTEGYLSAQPDATIRSELCEEAVCLATLLTSHPISATPETMALLALAHLHTARLPGRVDAAGDLLLLAEQDRTTWDRARIAKGLAWLDRAATGAHFSRYHAEAGIAAEHCLAPSFAATRWDRIVATYEVLDAHTPSPLHTLNHAVALAELRGPTAGLELLARLDAPPRVAASYLFAAVEADLLWRAGQRAAATARRRAALAKAPNDAVRALLERRFGHLS